MPEKITTGIKVLKESTKAPFQNTVIKDFQENTKALSGMGRSQNAYRQTTPLGEEVHYFFNGIRDFKNNRSSEIKIEHPFVETIRAHIKAGRIQKIFLEFKEDIKASPEKIIQLITSAGLKFKKRNVKTLYSKDGLLPSIDIYHPERKKLVARIFLNDIGEDGTEYSPEIHLTNTKLVDEIVKLIFDKQKVKQYFQSK